MGEAFKNGRNARVLARSLPRSPIRLRQFVRSTGTEVSRVRARGPASIRPTKPLRRDALPFLYIIYSLEQTNNLANRFRRHFSAGSMRCGNDHA